MSIKAERWLAKREIAVLEATYELESPPEEEDSMQRIRLQAERVRAGKAPATASQSNGAITE
jgi:hypothetical protein